MLLHNNHALSNVRSMFIETEDTDVFIICLSIFRQISGNMYIQYGTKNKLVILTLAKLGSLVVKMSCSTRCYLVGAFNDRGKVSTLKASYEHDEGGGGRLLKALGGWVMAWVLS